MRLFPCSNHPETYAANLRNIARFGVDSVGAAMKLVLGVGLVATTLHGGSQVFEAIRQNDLPLTLDWAKRGFESGAVQGLPIIAVHYLQKFMSAGPSYRPGDYVPTKTGNNLRIIK